MEQVKVSNSVSVKVFHYDNISDQEKTEEIQCDFNRENFCKSNTDAHIFEIFYNNEEWITAIKQDQNSFALIRYLCNIDFDSKA